MITEQIYYDKLLDLIHRREFDKYDYRGISSFLSDIGHERDVINHIYNLFYGCDTIDFGDWVEGQFLTSKLYTNKFNAKYVYFVRNDIIISHFDGEHNLYYDYNLFFNFYLDYYGTVISLIEFFSSWSSQFNRKAFKGGVNYVGINTSKLSDMIPLPKYHNDFSLFRSEILIGNI